VTMPARGRNGGGGSGGGLRIAVIAVAGFLGLAIVFGAGMLVGRHWESSAAREAAPRDPAATPAKKAAAGRRTALGETEAERPREAADKLTFYHTLTAPLGPAPSYGKPSADGKARAGASTAAATSSEGAAPPATAAAATAAPAAAAAGSWSVQVGAFDSRPQADALQQDLRRAGFEAYLTTLGTPDGKTRYRVRVGTFADRALAQRAADRLRAERSLPTFVTN
jgi:DedD protein